MTRETAPLLSARHIDVAFKIRKGFSHRLLRAVKDVSLDVAPGETLGVVGESGSGKSTLGQALLRLIRPNAGKIVFDGQDITALSEAEMRPVRERMQMVFQDPYTSLNPRKTVRHIIGDVLRAHGQSDRQEIDQRVGALLESVGLHPQHASRLPRAFSGGQRQRIGIARALALNPKLIIADEPVSALDVSVQAQVINLLDDLQARYHLTYVLIAHDLGLIRQIATRVAVMYLGRLVEVAPAEALYTRPRHPYTEALLSVVPIPDPEAAAKRQSVQVKGELPSPLNPPPGCAFHTRCPYARALCREVTPPLVEHADGRQSACHFPLNADAQATERAREAAEQAQLGARAPAA